MRYLVYLLTLFFIGTAIAQNPTIVQGDYITNVFGPSNFVKNPNAQINTANVTVSNATVTRGTTTPLVAKSEFTITTSTATGYADWDLRAFDAGMKNNNCEARFTYRGFTVGSTKAQILQGANVVAELTLIGDANNPTQASINFPCGDLSAVTKFRLQQATASLTGTNEIGGIYVGLATNMANVAQSENVVQASKTSVQAFTSGVADNVIFNVETKDVYGEFDTTNGRFTAKRAGDYLIQSTILSDYYSWAAPNYSEVQIRKNNNIVCRVFKQIQATQTINLDNQVTCTISLAVGDYVQTHWDQNRGTTNVNTNPSYTYTSINRFPSSSELVVTPERQNVFGGVRFSSAGVGVNVGQGSAASATTTVYNSASISRTYTGKCSATTTANDIGCKIQNLPVGNYQVTFAGFLRSFTAANATGTNCAFQIYETSNASVVATISQVSASQASENYADGKNITGIFTNTSVGDRNFVLRAAKLVGATTGYCQLYTDTNNDNPQFIITPLDQPSNSALYVQGPVKAAATGAAISAGYAGYVQEATRGSDVNLSTTAGTFTDITGLSISLDPGVWEIESFGAIYVQGAAGTGQSGRVGVWQITDNSNNIQRENRCGFINSVQANTFMNCFVKTRLLVTTTTTYKARAASIENSGATTNPTAVQVNATGTALAVLRAVRVN